MSIFYGRVYFDMVKEIVEENNERGNLIWFMIFLGILYFSVMDVLLLEFWILSFMIGVIIDVY